jgi:hypothetical protein
MQFSEVGSIVSLWIHPEDHADLMIPVKSLQATANKGIEGMPSRYYDRDTMKNHVSIISVQQIDWHAERLKTKISPGLIRSNIETTGIDWECAEGDVIKISPNPKHSLASQVILGYRRYRTPCKRMDVDIAEGAMKLMKRERQGILTEILTSGTIKVGDFIWIESPTLIKSPDDDDSGFVFDRTIGPSAGGID